MSVASVIRPIFVVMSGLFVESGAKGDKRGACSIRDDPNLFLMNMLWFHTWHYSMCTSQKPDNILAYLPLFKVTQIKSSLMGQSGCVII
jgi:hypothetical protein